jgi:hypothetical protein
VKKVKGEIPAPRERDETCCWGARVSSDQLLYQSRHGRLADWTVLLNRDGRDGFIS